MTQPSRVFASRVRELSQTLAEHDYAAAAVLPGSTFYYLTGLNLHLMERPTVLVVTAAGDLRAIMPNVERSNWIRAVPDAETVFWNDSDGSADAFLAVFGQLDGKIAVEGLRMRVRERDAIAAVNSALIILDGQEIISSIRLHKSQHELEIIREAIAISQAALETSAAKISLGMSETDLKRILMLTMLEEGADGPAFDPIVLFGAAAADCHGQSSRDRRLHAGDAVLIDFGAAYGGYNADITRTFFAREVADSDRRLYEAVLIANEVGRATAKPGVTASELDQRVTGCLIKAGYADHVVHKTGHGLGIDVHESPQIMIGNDQDLRSGMVFTIEPGLYIHGRIGVRIEDNIVITEQGADSLTSFPRDLTLVD